MRQHLLVRRKKEPELTSKPAFSDPTKVTAEEGEVVLDGPDGVGLSMTPGAAEETSRRLKAGAEEARAQRPEGRTDSGPGLD